MSCDIPGEATHGGPDAQGVPRHDFSTNANACGPCPRTLAALQAADATRYPDPAYAALREALAGWHGVAPERIVLAASASEFIARITAAVARGKGHGGRCIAVPRHAYGDYARAAQARGLAVHVDGEMPEMPEMPQLVWACDPASPLGIAQPGLAERIEALPADTPLVLDRAYEPLRLQGAPALQARHLARIWQLWSPNKALGLTGVRGAYAIAPEGAAQRGLRQQVQRLAPSWPLGAHAVAMLHSWATPATQHWVSGCLPTLRDWKAQQQALCRALGWQVLGSEANYFCAVPNTDALPSALQQLRAAGIKLRDCASFGLPGHVRLGVRPPQSQAALRAAWLALGRKQSPQ